MVFNELPFYFSADYDWVTHNPLIQRPPYGQGTPFPTDDYFLYLTGQPFYLLTGQHFLLLGE